MTLRLRGEHRSLSHRRAAALGATTLLLVTMGVPFQQATASSADCAIPDDTLEETDIPDETSVIECDLVGRVIQDESGEGGVTIPEPGNAVRVTSLMADGTELDFSVEVDADGIISFPHESTVDTDESAAAAAADPGECVDQAFKTFDQKEYDIYNWYIGDGGMPGGLSQSAAKTAFADAINNITGSTNNCSYSDQVSAQSSYKGTTTYEADINSSSQCTDRDEKSTWDAGNLAVGTVAVTCSFSLPIAGAKNDLREADVRFNTTDHDFTNSPGSTCSGAFDIRSVGTHETGHVFGMDHVGSGHSNLTMYTGAAPCDAKGRTLGVGDVLGLRSVY